MRIKNKKSVFLSLLKAKLLNKKIPLAVRWQLTDRCILQCRYCNIWRNPREELTFEKMLSILDQLMKLGTQTISFSGGEPMLRKDIGEILFETKKRKISTEMNSSGAMIPQNISKLKYLDFLKISLDGPENVQNFVRGEGAYKIAMEAAKAAKINNINFIFTTTLTKYNIKQIDFFLGIAKEHDTLVAFQPIKSLYRGVKDISQLSPDVYEFKQSINKLIKYKKMKNLHFRNSLIGLKHIYNWPHYEKLKCWAGKIFCIIDTDGTLCPCDRIFYNTELPNCLKNNFKEAFFSLPEVLCSGCGFCGVLELNLLMALRFGTVRSILDVLK